MYKADDKTSNERVGKFSNDAFIPQKQEKGKNDPCFTLRWLDVSFVGLGTLLSRPSALVCAFFALVPFFYGINNSKETHQSRLRYLNAFLRVGHVLALQRFRRC